MSEVSSLRERAAELEKLKSENERIVKRLAEAEQRFRETVDLLPTVVVEYDVKGQVTYVNNYGYEMLGYPPSSTEQNLSISQLLPEDELAKHRERLGKLLKGENLPPCEYRLLLMDGSTIYAFVSSAPIHKDGRIVGVRSTAMDITQRRQAEEALKNSEERLRILFEFAPDGYYLSDMKGNFVDGNKAAEELVGYKREELIGKNFLKLNLLPKWQIPKAAAHLARNAMGQPTGPDDFTLNRKDGDQVTVEIRTFPVKIDNRNLVLGIARDTTDRNQAEEALRKESSFRSAVIQRAAEGLCVCHQTSTYPFLEFTLWNDRMTEITGYTMEEVNRLGWYQTLYNDPELQERAKERMEKMRRGHDLYDEEWEITRSDGEKRVLNISTSVIESTDDTDHVLALMHDITERKRMEEELQEGKRRYALAAGAGKVGVWDWNTETNEIYVDPNLKAILGYTDHEIRNHLDEWGSLVHPDDAELVMAEAEAYLDGLKPQYEVTHRMLHKDGSVRWFLARGTAIRDEKGKPYRVVGTDTDITERMQMEEELRESEAQFRVQASDLEEVNAALKVLLKRREEDKIELSENVQVNVKELVLPYFEKLKKSQLQRDQMTLIGIIESHLKDIVSPFITKLSSKFIHLTPSEIKLADLIKAGKTIKETAELLDLSENTVKAHRHHIRSKLGLRGRKINLRSYLRSLE
jgi:PAS domain S-box-containing protein